MFIPEGKEISTFALDGLADFYKSFPADHGTATLKVLDYGCGPSLAYSISAASKATELVLADYDAGSRKYLQKWLDGDTSVYDWMPQFQYVVESLEGGTMEDVERRKDDLRKKVKAVVHCDLLKDDFIDKQYKGTYDVVVSLLCLEVACKDRDSYKSGVMKLSSLIKDGGHLVLLSTRRENADIGFYTVNGVKFSDLALKRNFVVKTLQEAGLVMDIEKYLPLPPHRPSGDSDGMLFTVAHKGAA